MPDIPNRDELGLSYLGTWLTILQIERSGYGDSLSCGLHYQVLSNIEKELKRISRAGYTKP